MDVPALYECLSNSERRELFQLLISEYFPANGGKVPKKAQKKSPDKPAPDVSKNNIGAFFDAYRPTFNVWAVHAIRWLSKQPKGDYKTLTEKQFFKAPHSGVQGWAEFQAARDAAIKEGFDPFLHKTEA